MYPPNSFYCCPHQSSQITLLVCLHSLKSVYLFFKLVFSRQTLIFRTVLDLWRKWEESTVNSHVPHTQFPLLTC